MKRCRRVMGWWPGPVLLAGVFGLLFAAGARAGEAAGAGRKIFAEHSDAVISLRLVLRTRVTMGGREMDRSESTHELTATVIAPSGLAVFSRAASSPDEVISRVMSGLGEEAGESGFGVESEITEVIMRLADGREVPGVVVMRDPDLDLAFVRPVEEPDGPLPALDLSRAAPAAVLDQVVILGRLGRDGAWSSTASLDRIAAVISRPRTFYVVRAAGEDMGALGCPVFDLEGRLVGVMLLRLALSSAAGRGMFGAMFGGMSGGMGVFPVIMPAAEIAAVAGQVPGAPGAD